MVEHDVDLPRTLVFDAFVDEDLVAGWLADAVIVPEIGGEYNLSWPPELGRPETFGRVVALRHPDLLIVDTTNLGILEFTLDELPGGMRGTATRVRVLVRMAGDPVLAEAVGAQWATNLEQLEELLRGHPTDWSALPRG